MDKIINVASPIDNAFRFLIMAKRILDDWPPNDEADANATKAASVAAELVKVAMEQLILEFPESRTHVETVIHFTEILDIK